MGSSFALGVYHSSLESGGLIYGLRNSLLIISTLALASFDLMARKAEKAAVPPPTIKYGACFGNSEESLGAARGGQRGY